MIDIVYITDFMYTMPTLVSAKSLVLNKNEDTEYNIHFMLTNGPKFYSKTDAYNVDYFDELSSDKVKVSYHLCEDKYKEIKDLHHSVTGRATSSALIKFLLPELLDCDKCIYLDGDTIITGDLTELYNTPIKTKLLAGVRDSSNLYINRETNDNFDYFNSGVMVMNLKKMREDKITYKLIEAKKNQLPQIKFADQEAFNTVCKGKCKLVDLKWNFLV